MKHFFSKAIFASILFSLTMSGMAQERRYNDSWGKQGISIVSESKGAMTLNYSVTEFEMIAKNRDQSGEVHISLPNHFLPNDAGMPDLPGSGQYIAIPQGAEAKLAIKNFRTEIIENVDLAPAAPIPFDKEEEPEQVEKNMEVYSKNAFFPAEPVVISEKTSVRGVDAVILGVTPFQYNPVTKELKVYRDIEIELTFEGGNGIVGEERLRSPHFDPILRNIFLNHTTITEVDYEKRYRNSKEMEGCEYLIVIPNDPEWRPYAEQIREWRTKQGIITKVMSLEEIGQTSADGLRTFFHDAYNNWDIPPVAVLLMADYGSNATNRITAHTVFHSYYYGNAITDNKYADINNDNLPEMVFARMAAEDTAQLAVMTSKMLDYEANPPTEADFYHKPITALGWQTVRWFQICSEVVGGFWRQQGKEPVRINAIYEGTPGSVWSTAQNTAQVVNYFGQNGLGYLPASPTELGEWSGGTAQMVVDAVNEGAFALQHRDHGYLQGWGEPDFSVSHINQMNNVGKLTYVFSINCETGMFDNSTACLAERFHRHTYNGENAGAVGVLAPTQVSYSFVNDCFVWGVYDLMQPDFMDYGANATVQGYEGNWMPAFGNVNGKYFLQQSAWPYNADNKIITYQMFTAHSGAFLRLFTEVPQELEIVAPTEIMMGTTEIEIGAPEGTTVACTIGDIIIAVATATEPPFMLELPVIDSLTTITLTATKQNFYRYTTTIEVIGEFPKPLNLNAKVELANHVVLTWETPESKDLIPTGYNIYRNDVLLDGCPIKEEQTFIDTVAANGSYTYYLTALYGANFDYESDPTEPISITIDGMCMPMETFNVEIVPADSSRMITWEAPDYEGVALLGYNVYREEEQLNEELIASDVFEYLDEEELEPGDYCYLVAVVYEDCEEPLFAPEHICIEVMEPEGIYGVEAEQWAQVYPNPAHSQITVVAENMKRITIFNVAGQLVKEIECNNSSITISVSDIEAGVYLLQINADAKTIVKRISIIR